MIDHFQEDQILSGYNPRIIRRLVRYALPFRLWLLLAGVCLVFATMGEMLIPVIIQQTIDREVLDYWVRLDADLLDELDLREEAHILGDAPGARAYIREYRLDRFPRVLREDLRSRGQLGEIHYILVRREVLEDNREVERRIAPEVTERGEIYLSLPRSVLDDLTRQERRILRSDNVRGLRTNAFRFFVVLCTILVGGFGQVYLTAWVGQSVMKRLRLDLFDHTMRQHLGYLGNQPVGRLVTRVTNDVETINELFASVLAELARNVSLMIAVVITMVTLNARLAAIVLVSMLPVILVTNSIRKRARTVYRSVRHAVSGLNAYLSEYISGMEVVQMFVQQGRSRHEFARRNDNLMQANLSEMYIFAVFRPLVDLLASISTAVVIFFGAILLNIELVSLGVLIAFINLIRRFYMPVMSISEQFTVLQSAMAGSERVFEMLDRNERISDEGTLSIPPESLRGAIQFRNVWFSYKPEEPVLKDLSFSADPGELVAIVGYTGSGKTTVINLLTRLWDVEEGSILLDGRDLKEYVLNDLRRGVQQIQQDVFLFDDTIRNNITLGKDVPESVLLEACETVQVAPFIRTLPDGLDTRLEERGTNLSTGQRQLIAFARVLVHDPPVLVLDEATSSIDSETERHLQHAVEAVTRGRTSLVVAHRLSTIQHAQKILVLSHGELVESGTHGQLLREQGLYATLYHLQYEQPKSPPPRQGNPGG